MASSIPSLRRPFVCVRKGVWEVTHAVPIGEVAYRLAVRALADDGEQSDSASGEPGPCEEGADRVEDGHAARASSLACSSVSQEMTLPAAIAASFR